jgi:hypothetical protein
MKPITVAMGFAVISSARKLDCAVLAPSKIPNPSGNQIKFAQFKVLDEKVNSQTA